MERVAIYAGSFDPFTKGHLDLVRRAVSLFDRVIVVVSHQVKKTYLFSMEERTEMVRQELQLHFPQVQVFSSTEMTVEVARKQGAQFLIRGVRTFGDYELEYNLALANRYLAPEIETVFLLASMEYAFLSSGLVKEMMFFGRDVRELVGEYTYEQLQQKISH